MTAVQVGNYGINEDDVESDGPKVKGFVVRELSPVVSNWRATTSLEAYLAEASIRGIEGIDTRAIAKKLRVSGALNACISTEDISDARLLEPVDEDFYRVSGTAAGSRVEVLTAGLVDAQPVALELQIESDTGLVTLMDFTTVGEAGETRWLLQLSEFGEPVSISPPEDG